MLTKYYWKHDLAPDMYIKTRDVIIGDAGFQVKAEVYTYLSPIPWEIAAFFVPHEKMHFWKAIKNPRGD